MPSGYSVYGASGRGSRRNTRAHNLAGTEALADYKTNQTSRPVQHAASNNYSKTNKNIEIDDLRSGLGTAVGFIK